MRLLTALLLFVLALPLWADDVTDWIDDGKKAYTAGNYSEAAQSLEYAAQMIRQLKGESFTEVFPAAPAGWKQQDSEASAVSSSLMGGATSATTSYERERDGMYDSVRISITTDSPMLSMVSMAFSNPMFMSGDGQRMIKINGQKALLDYDASDRSGDIQIVLNQNVLISIDGSGVSEEELRSFATGIDFDKVSEIAE